MIEHKSYFHNMVNLLLDRLIVEFRSFSRWAVIKSTRPIYRRVELDYGLGRRWIFFLSVLR